MMTSLTALAPPSGSCVWVRVEEHQAIGGGHFTRCLALAVQLLRRGTEVVFAFSELSDPARDRLADLGIRQVVLPAWSHPDGALQDALALLAQIEQLQCGGDRPALVVDVYRLDARWHAQMRAAVGTICVIDDLNNRPYDCDLLVDPTLGKSAEAYRSWLSRDCELCLGPQFALLREQFSTMCRANTDRERRVASSSTGSLAVMVTMGSADENNATEKVLKALRELPTDFELNVTVVLGALNPHVQSVGRVLAASKFQVHRLLRNVSNMAERLWPMDLCISAAGSTLWECCALGIPTVALQTTDNQSEVMAGLQRAQAIVAAGHAEKISRSRLAREIHELLRDECRREQLTIRGRGVCDGQGAGRVSSLLLELQASRKTLVA